MLKRDLAADGRQRGAAGTEGRLGRRIEDVAKPRHREACLVEILPDLRQPKHRRAHPSGQHVEGDQLADREATLDDELCPEEQDPGGNELAHELDALARYVPEAEHPEACRHVAGELLLPAPLHLRLDRHRLEGLDTGDALDQERLVLGTARKLLVEPPPEQRRRPRRNSDIEWECS
jgi:hypothetical protein